MKKILVYFPYKLGQTGSGSGVRPIRILQAFNEYCSENNYELIEIHGENIERAKKVKSFIREIDSREVLFCYMENSTMPFWLTDQDHIPRKPLLELKLFKYLNREEIPLGLFYRDVHWKFDEIYPLTGLKKLIMKNIYTCEYKIFKKHVNHFFLPSLDMNEYMNFPKDRTSSSPPGGEKLLSYRRAQSDLLNIIYVGGISKRYGIDLLIKSVEEVYKRNKKIRLHLVCRAKEYEEYSQVFEQIRHKSWLHVYHASGDELKEIYSTVDIGIITLRRNRYNNFAVPIKLFEYISYGLPVVATNCNAQAKIIEDDKLGIVVDDDVDSLVKGIEYFTNKDNIQYHSNKVSKSLISKHLWKHRVEEIASILSKK